MKICPECHKLSRDDDFCSHCGAAVYPDNSYSGSNISCDSYREFDGGSHSHEKQTYTRPYSGQDSPPAAPAEGGRKNKGAGCVVWVILLFVFFGIIDSLGEDFWEWLGELLELIVDG